MQTSRDSDVEAYRILFRVYLNFTDFDFHNSFSCWDILDRMKYAQTLLDFRQRRWVKKCSMPYPHGAQKCFACQRQCHYYNLHAILYTFILNNLCWVWFSRAPRCFAPFDSFIILLALLVLYGKHSILFWTDWSWTMGSAYYWKFWVYGIESVHGDEVIGLVSIVHFNLKTSWRLKPIDMNTQLMTLVWRDGEALPTFFLRQYHWTSNWSDFDIIRVTSKFPSVVVKSSTIIFLRPQRIYYSHEKNVTLSIVYKLVFFLLIQILFVKDPKSFFHH